MIDLVRLREALEIHENMGGQGSARRAFALVTVEKAARAYADLLEGGERRWMCSDGVFAPVFGRLQDCYFTGGAHGPDCGWRLLVPVPEETP